MGSVSTVHSDAASDSRCCRGTCWSVTNAERDCVLGEHGLGFHSVVKKSSTSRFVYVEGAISTVVLLLSHSG